VTLEAAVRRYLDPTGPDSVYLGIVHRLDRPTSGVILWAKTEKAARRLATQFQHRRAVKEYWAIVESSLPVSGPERSSSDPANPTTQPDKNVWNDWLTRPDESGQVSAVAPNTPGAREAVTHLCVGHARSLPAGCSWLRLWPVTGRTHQLRIQAARRGTPILFDAIYGATSRLPHPDRILLHARSLTIKHPASGQQFALVAPVPAWWADVGAILPE
jgi:23S rRNA pseudouridine1911/1915/1917 synthase